MRLYRLARKRTIDINGYKFIYRIEVFVGYGLFSRWKAYDRNEEYTSREYAESILKMKRQEAQLQDDKWHPVI